MRPYRPCVDEYRIEKRADTEGAYWLWQFEIDGCWVFRAALQERTLGERKGQRRLVHEDDRYEYWR